MKLKILIGAGVLVVGAIVAALVLYDQATTTKEAKVVDVVAEFRASAKPDQPAKPGLPKQGVYRYAVTGKEKITRGVAISRDLPAAAPALVRHTADGFEVETRYSDQHIEMARYALQGDGAYVTFAVTTISAGPIKTVRERSWSPKLLRFPLAPKPGQTWGGDFTAGDLKLNIKSRMLPKETVTVGGTPVETQVAEFVQKITGEYTGDRTETYWYAPKLGVIVRYKIDSSLKGPTNLDFHADQTLQAVEPEV
jgi:hypothetical protein